MSEKMSLEEQIGKLTLAAGSWVEPMRQWIKTAVSLKKIAENAELVVMKQAFSEIEGLNLFFSKKEARLLPRPEAHSPQENIWVLLRKTLEKTGATRLKSLESPFLVRGKGLEPSWVAPLAPKASASTNFATRARRQRVYYTI